MRQCVSLPRRCLFLASALVMLIATGCADNSKGSFVSAPDENANDAIEEASSDVPNTGDKGCTTNADCQESLGAGNSCQVALCDTITGACFFG